MAALTGTVAATFSQSATCSGAGALVGECSVSFSQSGEVGGGGALVGTCAATFDAAASILGIVEITFLGAFAEFVEQTHRARINGETHDAAMSSAAHNAKINRTEDRAVKAWMAFENAVSRHGYIRSVDFDDKVINATVRALGGWEHCCGMPAAEFDTFLQKRFQDTYCALSRSGISGEQAEPLLGWCDKQNGLNGYGQKPAALIETGNTPTPSVRITQRKQYTRPDVMPRLELKKA